MVDVLFENQMKGIIMKLTKAVKSYVEEKWLPIYCNQLKVSIPDIVYRHCDVMRLPKNITNGRRYSARKYLGVCYMYDGIIFINVKKFQSIVRLKRTLAHELIHLRFPHLSHGREFEKKIDKLMKRVEFRKYRGNYKWAWDGIK